MPTKAAYKTFETSPETEFEFYLATKLGMTVGMLRESLSNDEFLRWSIYYQRIAQQEQLREGSGT